MVKGFKIQDDFLYKKIIDIKSIWIAYEKDEIKPYRICWDYNIASYKVNDWVAFDTQKDRNYYLDIIELLIS